MTLARIEERYTLLIDLGVMNMIEDMQAEERRQMIVAMGSMFCLCCGQDMPASGHCPCIKEMD